MMRMSGLEQIICLNYKDRRYSSGIPTNKNNFIRNRARRKKKILFVGKRKK